MTHETDQLDYTDCIVNLMIIINEHSARDIALDLWKYYPNETLSLYAALTQTQHTKPIPRLLQKDN